MGLRPTFMGYEASKSALYASQKALDVVGQNLSNMASEGYTRQRVDQVAVDTYAYRNRKSDTSYNHVGMGTDVKGVQQVRDERTDTAFRQSYAETSYYSRSNDMYSEIENIISEIDEGTDGTGYGLSWGMKEIYTALEDLAVNANDSSLATVFADSVSNITTLLNTTATKLEESRNSYVDEIYTEVKDANSILTEIGELNKQISDIMAGSGYTDQYGPNELLDKRNVLLDELSSFGKLDVQNEEDGSVTVKLNGHECVKGAKSDLIDFYENNDRTVTLKWKSDGSYADSDKGILKASLEIVNGTGSNAAEEESSARGYRYYQDTLDAFASKLAEVLNSSIPDKLDAQGNVISYKKFVGAYTETDDGSSFVNSDKKVSASDIAITDALYNDPTYVMYDKNSSDGTYFTNLVSKLQEKQDFANGYEEYHGTFNEFLREYASRIGGDVSYSKAKYEACETYSDELQSQRENVSGVSESEETVNMLTYNKAFQAAAKMMTTMDEILDVIINQVGALG